MKHTNKKGFTIVELVIVIAVIAILAAVLIPTFSNLIKKANISNDTAIAKNLNTAAISAQADTFAQAIEAAKEAGYLVAHLNAKSETCYFVWEDESNQFLLFDIKDGGKVVYSNTKVTSTPNKNWIFIVNNADEEKAVTDFADVTANYLVGDVAALKDVLAAGGYIYLDESLVLDAENLLVLGNADATTTLVLGSSQLNTNGILEDKIPIQVNAGTVNIVGGTIGAAGSYVDADGKVVNTPISVNAGGAVNIDGTTFNVAASGYLYLNGNNTVKNATINTEGMGIYARGTNVVENTVITSADRIVWACNHNTEEGTMGLITFKSGTYTGGSAKFAAIVTCGSFVKIEGGDFNANEGAKLFQIHNNDNGGLSIRSTIVITGGTFNGVDFADLDEAEWNALCGKNTKATISEDGKTVTISFSAN